MVITQLYLNNINLKGEIQMYYRIKNTIDAQIFAENFSEEKQVIGNRIKEIADILDGSYGSKRKSSYYGGYVLYFPTQALYNAYTDKILDFYNLDKTMYEYTGIIGGKAINGIMWYEELFLLSSYDSLILIHLVKITSKCRLCINIKQPCSRLPIFGVFYLLIVVNTDYCRACLAVQLILAICIEGCII